MHFWRKKSIRMFFHSFLSLVKANNLFLFNNFFFFLVKSKFLISSTTSHRLIRTFLSIIHIIHSFTHQLNNHAISRNYSFLDGWNTCRTLKKKHILTQNSFKSIVEHISNSWRFEWIYFTKIERSSHFKIDKICLGLKKKRKIVG